MTRPTEKRKHFINLIVDAFTESETPRVGYAAVMINGLGFKPLRDMTLNELRDFAWEMLEHCYVSEESPATKPNKDALDEWLLSQKAEDWCEDYLYPSSN
jgi:hypothetical protein